MRKVHFLVFSLISLFAFSQELSEQQQGQVDSYIEALKAATESNQTANAASISGKIAFIFWNSLMFDDAINYYQKSIEFNLQVNNRNGVKSVRFQLGLVKIDKEDYKGALEEFKQGVTLADALQLKTDVLSGLINIASIEQSLARHQSAVTSAEEALIISQELDNLNLTKRCYGILYESYQALGNSEKSIEYFDLYSTVDKFLKAEQVKQITKASEQKVQQMASAKRISDEKLEDSQAQLMRAQDSLRLAREITERQRLQLKLNELTIREKEAQLENERLIRYGLTTIVTLTLIFLGVLYIQYRQKKQKNKLLEAQNEKITSQNSEIEKQGQDLAIKNDELMAVNKEKNLMMSMVAHDLKKPINDLTSLAYILEQYQDKLPEDFNNLVGVLQRSAGGYRDMVHKILDAGAIENRKLNVVEEKISLEDILHKNAESQQLVADKKNIKIDYSDVPKKSFVKADRIYLGQAIENVLYNSMKYSPDNSTVYLGAKRENGHFNVYVKDHGPGISPEDQKHLFDSFKVLKNGDKESTGLGLSISKKYMEAIGGEITCESEIDKGTTFFFKVKRW